MRCLRPPIGFQFLSDSLNQPMHQTVPTGGSPFAPAGTDEPEPSPEPALLTIPKVAAWLGTSEKTVRRRIKEGVIRTVPMGGRLVRIAPDEVRRLARGDPAPEP